MEPAYYWFNARPGRETFAENVRKTWGAGSPDETPELWKTLSQALNVERIHALIVMQVSEQEAQMSIELVSRLDTEGIGETQNCTYATKNKVETIQDLAAYEGTLRWIRI